MARLASVRDPLRAVLYWASRSPRVPYAAKSRLRWRRDQYCWVARRPDTFTGKVQWKVLKDRRPLLTTFADKVAVRGYVADIVGPEILADCYAVAADPRDIDQRVLPREFVAKVSHGCGGIWFVTDRGHPEADVPPNTDAARRPAPDSGWDPVFSRPEAVDWSLFARTFRAWLSRSSGYLEWAYQNVPPRMLVEELLCGTDGDLPNDYKVYVFHGRARLVHVDIRRFKGIRRRIYLPDWTPLDVRYDREFARVPLAPVQSPPASLSRMIEIAEALGQKTDFVRVDLYDIDGRIVFGELTSYPGGGNGEFTPAAFDFELGRWWRLPPSYSPRHFR